MSEYMEKHSVARLIGAPPGYVGYEQGGALTEAVRRRPYSVVLFDEVEKAHPDVFNILLQVLDDGRLTDSQGHVVDFKNTIIILTSNLGAEAFASEKLDTISPQTRDYVMNAVRQAFRPEFLNRLDEIVLFNRLLKHHMASIIAIQLKGLQKRLADRHITIQLSKEALDWLMEAGYDPLYGARPLRRVIQRHIQDPLAMALLEGKVANDTVVSVIVKDNDLAINVS
jgi:ATP-dependent Clp protease ATP-binding subunit ClpB